MRSGSRVMTPLMADVGISNQQMWRCQAWQHGGIKRKDECPVIVKRVSVRRMTAATGVIGSLLTGLLCATPASAATVDAVCVAHSSGKLSDPLDPGTGNDKPQAEKLTGSGTVKCTDANGDDLGVTGKVRIRESFSGLRCNGNADSGSVETETTWSDGTVSKETFSTVGDNNVDGISILSFRGTVSSDSTKFAGDTVTLGGIAIGSGCGTAHGETGRSATPVISYSH